MAGAGKVKMARIAAGSVIGATILLNMGVAYLLLGTIINVVR